MDWILNLYMIYLMKNRILYKKIKEINGFTLKFIQFSLDDIEKYNNNLNEYKVII